MPIKLPALVLLALLAFFIPKNAVIAETPKTQCYPRQYINDFIGKNTFIVDVRNVKNSKIRHYPFESEPKEPSTYDSQHPYTAVHIEDEVVLDTLKNVFQSNDWIDIFPRDKKSSDFDSKIILNFSFYVSGRKEIVGDKEVTAASISLMLWKYNAHGFQVISAENPEAYPFIVSSNPEELKKSISDAVKKLTSWMPQYFSYIHDGSIRSHICPDL